MSASAPDRDPLRAALRQTRVNIGLLFGAWVVLAVTLAAVALYWRQLADIEEDRVLAALAERVEANADVIVAEVKGGVARAAPSVTRSFYRQIRADLPVYARALEEQSGELAEDLETDLLRISEAKFDRYLDEHWQVLREEFPEITDEKTLGRMKDEFRQAYRRLIRRYYVADFRTEAARTAALWRRVEPVAPPEGQDSLEDQLLDYFVAWSTENLVDAAEARVTGGQ